ncbi:MAG: hypothetical protein NTU97_00885 [Candidatus Magasanikbacteria bacterium]|nr:hypothetical protein [Candidatus Magasanikbacteria bacterium]
MPQFKKEADLQLLDAVGVVYGHLTGEDFDTFLVICLEQGRLMVQEGVNQNLFTPDEAQLLDEAMEAADLLPTYADVFQKVLDYQLPDGFTSELNFRVCGCPHPLVHGYIRDKEDAIVGGGGIETVFTGLGFCSGGVDGGHIDIPTAAYLFKQMVAANLPQHDDARQKLIEALPEDVQIRLKEETERRNQNPLARIMALLQSGG